MVDSIDTASMDELADQEHRGFTREHDVLMGDMYVLTPNKIFHTQYSSQISFTFHFSSLILG